MDAKIEKLLDVPVSKTGEMALALYIELKKEGIQAPLPVRRIISAD